jgi:hypothetical protein
LCNPRKSGGFPQISQRFPESSASFKDNLFSSLRCFIMFLEMGLRGLVRESHDILGVFVLAVFRSFGGFLVSQLTFGGFLISGFRFNGLRFSPRDLGFGSSLIIFPLTLICPFCPSVEFHSV